MTRQGHLGDERPCKWVKDRVVIEVHATIYHALGIPLRLAYDVEERPFFVTNNGTGKPIMSLFA